MAAVDYAIFCVEREKKKPKLVIVAFCVVFNFNPIDNKKITIYM